MSTLTIALDNTTEIELQKQSESSGIPPSEYAARLLRRAVRARRPRPVWDIEQLKAYAAEYGEEELALADSDSEHRLQLLIDEDNAE